MAPAPGRARAPQSCGTVRLSVGGAEFEASAEDLRRGSPWFSALLSGAFPIPRDEEGAVFIDRDWTHFWLVLDFVRFGPPCVEARLRALRRRELAALLREAEFYRLDGLAGEALRLLGADAGAGGGAAA